MESFGMPCSNSVFVLLILDISQLPSCLVLERWTKKAKNIEGVNFQQCELSRESVKTSRYGTLIYTNQNNTLVRWKMLDNITVDQVRDPIRVRTKGRVAEITSRPKRGNQCGICREIGHNRASCPNVVGSCSRTFDNDFDEEQL
ncbi:hypothetical protein Lal_00019935 [Lupinus albus]|nr:hypothetical protein Lal_00019935 [Lupinus albus]